MCDIRLQIRAIDDFILATENQSAKKQQKRPVSPERYSVQTQEEDFEEMAKQKKTASLYKKPKMNCLWVTVPSEKMEQKLQPQTPERRQEEAAGDANTRSIVR